MSRRARHAASTAASISSEYLSRHQSPIRCSSDSHGSQPGQAENVAQAAGRVTSNVAKAFVQIREDEWDIYYAREAQSRVD